MVLHKFLDFVFDLLIGAVILIIGFFLISNPNSEQLASELRASFHQEVGDNTATIAEDVLDLFGDVDIYRKNYYIFSCYSITYKPVIGKRKKMGYYLGIAGSFINSMEYIELEKKLAAVPYDEFTKIDL